MILIAIVFHFYQLRVSHSNKKKLMPFNETLNDYLRFDCRLSWDLSTKDKFHSSVSTNLLENRLSRTHYISAIAKDLYLSIYSTVKLDATLPNTKMYICMSLQLITAELEKTANFCFCFLLIVFLTFYDAAFVFTFYICLKYEAFNELSEFAFGLLLILQRISPSR